MTNHRFLTLGGQSRIGCCCSCVSCSDGAGTTPLPVSCQVRLRLARSLPDGASQRAPSNRLSPSELIAPHVYTVRLPCFRMPSASQVSDRSTRQNQANVKPSHPFVERLIGTIRREYLDQLIYWNAADLQQKLGAFRHYYNTHRVHQGLAGHTPEGKLGAPSRPIATLANYR